MFRLTYRDKYDKDHSRTEYFDDIKDIGQALINLVDNEKEEQSAMNWCGRAHWGDKVVRQQFGYKLECFNEEQLKADIQAVADEISKHCGVANSFVGWDNDALTWDFNIGATYMKFHDNYGYYMTVNTYDVNGSPKNVWEFTSKNKKNFIEECVKALTKYGNKQVKNMNTNKRSVVETNNNQNKGIYKLVIHKVMNSEPIISKEYSDDRHGLHSIHCDIISFAKHNNIPMEYSDMLLDKVDTLKKGNYEQLIVGYFTVSMSRTEGKTINKNTLTAKEVVNAIKKADADGKEWHGRIYEDNCWWADLESNPNGQIVFWVGFEDKRSGKSKASIVTLAYLNNKGDLRYCTDGIQIKQAVWNKIQSVAKALIKENILNI